MIRKRHAIILGKTNMNELAIDLSSESHHFHAVKNHRDKTKVRDRSSSGSAAADAACMSMAAIGSDTSGTIRQLEIGVNLT